MNGVSSRVLMIKPKLKNKKLTILIIDDHSASRFLLSRQLDYLGHKVIVAEDGALGLKAWRAHQVDVVISDCNLPIIDGYTLTRTIRSEEQRRGAKPCLVLGVTANAQLYENDRCFDAGMDGCLFKPVSLVDLTQRLAGVRLFENNAHLREYKVSRGADIDLSSLELVTGNDAQAMKSLLNDLISSNLQDLTGLAKLSVMFDIEAIMALAHRVKGGARIIKAQGLISACEHVELAFQVGHPTVMLEASISSLKKEMTALAITLRSRLGTQNDC